MRRSEPKRGRSAAWLLGISALFVFTATHRLARPTRPQEVTATLRDTALTLRAAAETCGRALDQNTANFESYAARLDSLRERVRRLEAIDPRGVPADSYPAYIDTYDEYNDSVPSWSAQADTLRAQWARCRGITRSYNVLADSLRRWMTRLDSAG
ncbi:MAG: hypothetical protein ACREM1_10335 [Longimicrobiales bacterium]